MTLISKAEWIEFYRLWEEAHFLQSGEWGDLKQQFGWEVVRIINGGGGTQILLRKGPFGTRIGYIPKGPIGKITSELIDEIILTAKNRNCFALTLESDFWEGEIELGKFIKDAKPGRNIQPHRTLVISLAGNEDDWLGRMKQKTRYNIRLAEKKGVAVHTTEDISLFHSLMEKTGKRDGFGIHSLSYYQKVYECFASRGDCAVLLAEFEGQILGALMVIAHGKRSWYVYGASNDIERNRMPTYLLQWEAMRWAASKGCGIYDLWGIPDEDLETLEQQFETRSDGLWGVYRFKRGFGGEIKRSVGAVDIVINPLLYSLYRKISSRNNYQVG